MQSLSWQRNSSVLLIWFTKSQNLCYQSKTNQRHSSYHLTVLLYCSWLFHCQSQGIPLNSLLLKATADEMLLKWHTLKKMSLNDSTFKPQRQAEKYTGMQTQFGIFPLQCGWLCWSLCVYEVNSRLKCQIYHFGSLNQRRRGAYFFVAKMKCLFTEPFTFICSQVVSRINVSGWVNCEMFLWWVC